MSKQRVKKIKRDGMLNIPNLETFTKQVQKQNPKKNIDKLSSVQPDTGTGISYIEGTLYKNKSSKKKKKSKK